MLAASAALILAALLPGLPRADDAAPRPLVVLEEQEPQTSWPMLARTMSELRLGELLFDRLFVSRTGGSPVSRVFDEGWRTHGQDLVVAVREGMRFSDGSPVSFSDVAFTLNDVYRRAETGHLAAPWYARVLGDAKQSSPATGKIRFQVSMPERGAERYLVTTALLSQHALKAEAEGVDLAGAERRPIGTGPFHAAVPIADFDDITLQRNPHRLRDRSPEPGEVEAVRLLYDQDAARQRELMEGGRADVWVSPPPAVLPVFRADRERFGVRSYHLNQWWYVALSTGDGHLANPVVREALDLAIPRRQLVDKLGAESAQLTSGPFLPDSAWAPPDLSPTPEDPAGTRRLMEEAGYVLAGGRWTRDGAPVELRLGVEAGISDDFNDVLDGLVEAWEDAGFRIRVRAIGPSAWVQQVEAGQAGERWDLRSSTVVALNSWLSIAYLKLILFTSILFNPILLWAFDLFPGGISSVLHIVLVLAPWIMLDRRAGVVSALVTSFQMIRDHWWDVLVSLPRYVVVLVPVYALLNVPRMAISSGSLFLLVLDGPFALFLEVSVVVLYSKLREGSRTA